MAKAYAFLVRCLLSSSIKISTQKGFVTDHFNSDFELLHLQTTNINPVKAHFSLPVKLSESMSLSEILVSYLSLSDFELLEGRPPIPTRLWLHFSLSVKLYKSMSLSQILVSYLYFSGFELFKGRPPIPTRLWPHCVLLSQEVISPLLISSFQYR